MPNEVSYFGISGCQYAIGTADPVSMPFAKSLALNAVFNKQPIYADNMLILEAPSDQGYEGTLGLTTLSAAYEKALGMRLDLAEGSALVNQTELKRHNLYFETNGVYDDGTVFVIKNWLMGVTVAKPGRNYASKTDNIEFGEYAMPIRIFGTPVLTALGDEYRDANGNKKIAFIISCKPADTGYDTFEDAVPEAEMAA